MLHQPLVISVKRVMEAVKPQSDKVPKFEHLVYL